jgi:hypothetical protein
MSSVIDYMAIMRRRFRMQSGAKEMLSNVTNANKVRRGCLAFCLPVTYVPKVQVSTARSKILYTYARSSVNIVFFASDLNKF